MNGSWAAQCSPGSDCNRALGTAEGTSRNAPGPVVPALAAAHAVSEQGSHRRPLHDRATVHEALGLVVGAAVGALVGGLVGAVVGGLVGGLVEQT